jgi:hypothetical protein
MQLGGITAAAEVGGTRLREPALVPANKVDAAEMHH